MIRLPQIDLIKLKAKAILWGGVALIWLGSLGAAYFYGKAVQRTEYEADVVDVLKTEVKKTAKESKENAQEGEKAGREAAAMEARLQRAKEELDAAIEKARADRGSSCDLTDDELRALEAIYNSH